MDRDLSDYRQELTERIGVQLAEAGRPRLLMAFFLIVAGTAWFFTSAALLRLGVGRMAVRYPLAVAVAYLVLLGLLWGWMRWRRFVWSWTRQRPPMDLDGPEPPAGTVGVADPIDWEGIGDDKARTGMSAPAIAALGLGAAGLGEERRSKQGGRKGGGGGGSFDLGDLGNDACGVFVLLLVIAGICVLIVSAYLVLFSPMLFAELLVDGVVLAALSKSVGPRRAPHWTFGVWRRTLPAAFVTALVFGLVGYGFERLAPGATTPGAAWIMIRARH